MVSDWKKALSMNPFHTTDTVTIHHGDCLDAMRELPDSSIDAIVTDPPYGLGFMGKAWDDLPPGEEWARECLRVLKPGGHLLAFGGSRTWHRLAVAVEDAGFEIRDSIAWLYGSGFPKSLDVSKAIDKAAGVERGSLYVAHGDNQIFGEGKGKAAGVDRTPGVNLSDPPATPDAERWQGWGTALKPAFEPIVVGRKPLAGTVAANVLTHGTGALNIEGSRNESGRWPANVVLDDTQAAELDQQSGNRPGFSTQRDLTIGKDDGEIYGRGLGVTSPGVREGYNDSGGASRFFPTFKYQAKAPTRERPKVDGVAHPTVKPLDLMRWLVRLVTPPGGVVLEPFAGSGATVEACILEGFRCIAIEREAEYLPLILHRIERTA